MSDIDAIRKHPDRSIDDKFERVVAERDDLAGALVETERERDAAESKVAELTDELAKARKDRDDYAHDNTRLAVSLVDAGRKVERYADQLRADAQALDDDGVAVGLLRAADGLGDLLAGGGA